MEFCFVIFDLTGALQAARGVTVTATDPLGVLNELGSDGWDLATSFSVVDPDPDADSALIFHTFRRPTS